jgi:acyl-CoA thioesterase
MDDSTLEIIGRDPFAAHMGIEVLTVEDGRAVARMPLRDDHRNFLGLVHGGAIFALADVAFGAAANSWGTRSMAIHIAVDYLMAPGDTPYLEAEVRKKGRAGRTCHYAMEVRNAAGDVIAVLSGWAYQTRKDLATGATNP